MQLAVLLHLFLLESLALCAQVTFFFFLFFFFFEMAV